MWREGECTRAPIPTFASYSATLSCERRNRKEHEKTYDSSVPIPKFASLCGALACELRNRSTTACSGEVESLLISAHPRESGDPGSRTPALVALDSRLRGNERNMLLVQHGSRRDRRPAQE